MSSRAAWPAALALFGLSLGVAAPAGAAATLNITPLTWNVIGLDSNDVTAGPNRFPVGARVCSSVATTNVNVSFVWDSTNANVNLRSGSLSTIPIASIGAGQCADAYFEVEVTRTAAAFDTARRYHITATDSSGTVSTVTPRELFVEHLISQNRNAVTTVKYGPGSPASLTPVAPGGTMALVVGNDYTIELDGGTATQGYNQFEQFINFPNTIFQILSVVTEYSADDSPFVPNPDSKLYADACGWDNDPNSPTYRSCIQGDFKAGGSAVATTYVVKILSGGGTSQTLNTLLYDFSGSSYHYNSDFSTGSRIAAVIDPLAATIAKSFSPSAASVNGVSVLTFTLGNPNGAALSGYNVVDNLPANVVVAATPGVTTSGCGTPTVTATAGGSSIGISGATVAAAGSCLVSVNVTPTAAGSFVNTTNHLFIDTTDTGQTGTATLGASVTPPPPASLCSTAATWDFPTGFSTAAPAASSSTVAVSAAAGAGINPIATSHDSTINPSAGTTSWGSNGAIATGATLTTANNDYFEFAVNTTGLSAVSISFDAEFRSANGPKGLAVYLGTTNTRPETGTSIFSSATALGTQNTWAHLGPFTVNSGLNLSGNTYFRIYAFNAGNSNAGSDIEIDHVVLTGCVAVLGQPTIAKSFVPGTIAVNGTSTLTFTLTNPNTVGVTGAAFTDALPAGLQVAATPTAATTCAGATWSPAAGATSLSFSGGAIPGSGSCTASVNVTATTAGGHVNVSSTLSTTELGTNPDSLGTATLGAIAPPAIAKAFAPSPIQQGGTSTLTFTITNPNPGDALSGVAFSDTFPTAPGAMVVAATPAATTNGCGSPTFAPAAGSGSISFSGGSILAGDTCTVTVNVTAPVSGTYANTSGAVSHVINSQTISGNTASASLAVTPPHPSISLGKRIGLSATGPWLTYLAVSAGTNVYYQFVVENTGDVPLSPVSVTDPQVSAAGCSFTDPLPVAVAANENHISTCVVGAVTSTSGSHTNTAHATGTYGGTPYVSPDDSATYATTGLTLVKSVTETSFLNAGEVLHYGYLVTNSGFAPLPGPVTVTDDKTTVTCPAVTTVGDLDDWLDPGEAVACTATYTVTLSDVALGFVTNTASASAGGVTSNTDSKTVNKTTPVELTTFDAE